MAKDYILIIFTILCYHYLHALLDQIMQTVNFNFDHLEQKFLSMKNYSVVTFGIISSALTQRVSMFYILSSASPKIRL